VVVFAPTVRGVRINLVRTAILAAAVGARRVAGSLGLTERIKRGWRTRVRRGGQSGEAD